MPPRRPPADRNYSDMVDENALHITEAQASTFGEAREVLKASEAQALRQRAEAADRLRQKVDDLEEQIRSQTNSLMVADGVITVHDFQLTPTGLITPEHVTYESWSQIGTLLFRLEGSIQWLIGDWLAYGEDLKWGELPQIAAALGRDYGTLRNYASVARSIKLSFRNDNLTYTHHVAVMSLKGEEQEQALAYAARHKLSVADFRKWLRESNKKSLKRLSDYQATPSDQRREVYDQYRTDVEPFLLDQDTLKSLSRIERREIIHRAKWLLDSYADLIKAAKQSGDV